MDEVLGYVDKKPMGVHLGGNINFNERFQIITDKYLETSNFMGHTIDPAYLIDPMLKYRRDAFWFQQISILMQSNPAAIQAYFAYRPDHIELLKMIEKDMLEEDDE
jgi:hypothetical protein